MASDTTNKPLTKAETDSLERHEKTIEAGLKSFVEVGNALLAIRDGRLYRAEFGTFEAYCKERWDFTPVHSRRLIDAATVTEHLKTKPIGFVLPANESQARPLLSLRADDGGKGSKRAVDLEEVGRCWEEVVERAPRDDAGSPQITARHVQDVVNLWKACDDDYDDSYVEEVVEEEDDMPCESPPESTWKTKTLRREPAERLREQVEVLHGLCQTPPHRYPFAEVSRLVRELHKSVTKLLQ